MGIVGITLHNNKGANMSPDVEQWLEDLDIEEFEALVEEGSGKETVLQTFNRLVSHYLPDSSMIEKDKLFCMLVTTYMVERTGRGRIY